MEPQEYHHNESWSPTDGTRSGQNNPTRRWSSMSSIQTNDHEYRLRNDPLCPVAVSYNDDEFTKYRRTRDWLEEMHLHRTNVVIPSSRDDVSAIQNYRGVQATSGSYYVSPNECDLTLTLSHHFSNDIQLLPPEQKVMEHDSDATHPATKTSLLEYDNANNHSQKLHSSLTMYQSHDFTSSSPQEDASYHSISNSNCVPVVGRLVDLPDNEWYSTDYGSDNEGGIEILAESTDDDCEDPIRRQEPNEDRELLQNEIRTKPIIIDTLSMYENDSIIVAAAARVNENFFTNGNGIDSIEFEQLLHEADDRSTSESVSVECKHGRNTDQDVEKHSFWQRRNPFLLSKATKEISRLSRGSISQAMLQPPVRARSTQHDKYVVEVDILPLPSYTHRSNLEIRDVMDIMANIELLHRWFDPIPAIFEATVQDGSTEGYTSPQLSPSNSLDDNTSSNNAFHNNRQYDGQWVEISTPPLKIPPGAWLSGCSRSVRVAFRSMIGFPARIRSMIFVERSCGRMGMTLGPYPDGFMCNNGTMAYHTFHIRIRDEDGAFSGSGTSGRCVVISDEVRLQRDQDNDFNGIRRSCCLCLILRFMLGILERAILFRWYKPDLASYMQQTISSMEKLRSLVEGGESSAYHGGDLIMNDEEWQAGQDNRSPLLG